MIEKWTTPIPKLSGREGRTVYVYVPDEAQENPEARYPVLYMFDGQRFLRFRRDLREVLGDEGIS